MIEALQFPTLGGIEWTWTAWAFPAGNLPEPPNDGTPGPSFSPWLTSSPGVASRKLVDEHGNEIGTWTYVSETDPPTGSGPTRKEPVQKKVTVTTPLNDVTEHFFSVYFVGTPQDTAAAPEHYSLPFTVKTPVSGRYLSRRVYDGTSNQKRRMYVGYVYVHTLGSCSSAVIT